MSERENKLKRQKEKRESNKVSMMRSKIESQI